MIKISLSYLWILNLDMVFLAWAAAGDSRTVHGWKHGVNRIFNSIN
jgi:hypothetical protein